MNIQNAIDYFKNYIEFCKEQDMGAPTLDLYEIAIEAMEKQIQIKPTEKKILVEDTKFSIGECPNCGDKTNSDFKHCEHCGQAFDWSD